jgi:methyl-accepting chemotaxis protein
MESQTMTRQHQLIVVASICCSCTALAGAAILLAGGNTLYASLGAVTLGFSVAGLLCCLLAHREKTEPERIEVPVKASLGRFLDGFESLLAGDIKAAMPMPEQLHRNERERLETASASVRSLIQQNKHYKQPTNETVITAAPPPAEPRNKGLHSYQKHLNTLSQRLEQLAAQLLASTGANEESRDSTQEQLASLKLQARKLQDRSRSLGDSIDLLKDLAEQSGVLALNAAIQASRSGEDGLGVIADELQRVANRHSDASRQFDENLQQLNADLVDTNKIIETGRQHLQRGQHDVSQLRKHIAELARTCAGLRSQVDADSTGATT